MLRTAWNNWINDFSVTCATEWPTTKPELIATVRKTVAEERRIRAIGSGHSMSSCARPEDVGVNMALLAGAFPAVNFLRPSPPGLRPEERLIRVHAGTLVKSLNREILAPGLALVNMGSFDGQTIAGAVSTATHGSGITLGSLSDAVVSMDIVTVENVEGRPTVQTRRVEPTKGITSPTEFLDGAGDMILTQDDDTFHSMVVGYGCMGIALAYTLKVRTSYWLRETIDVVDFASLREDLKQTEMVAEIGTVPSPVADDRHFTVYLNVAEMQGKKANDNPSCMITRQNIVTREPEPKIHIGYGWPPERDHDLSDFLQGHASPDPRVDHDALGKAVKTYFEGLAKKQSFKGNRSATESFIALKRERENRSDSKPPDTPPEAISLEMAVPAHKVVDALELILDVIQRSPFFFSVPIGIRFGAPSKHFLSPAYGRATAYIEVPMVLASSALGGRRIDRYAMRDLIAKSELEKIEEVLDFPSEIEGRPHLGKHNTATHADLGASFPRFGTWLANFNRFNSFRTFDNSFTSQLGLRGSAAFRPPG